MSVVSEESRVEHIRREIVANALWGVDHAEQIHYSQTRPIDGINAHRPLPLTTDCSGFVTLCYRWAGAADPNGQGFSGYGFTGTILDHCTEIGAGDAAPGDLVVFGPGTADHVVVVIGDGPDPAVVSHGQEKGPLTTTLRAQIASHRDPVRFVRCPDVDHPEAQAQRELDLTSEPSDDLRTMANAATES